MRRSDRMILWGCLFSGLCAGSSRGADLPPPVPPQQTQQYGRPPANGDQKQAPVPQQPRTPAPPPIGEEVALPQPTPTYWDKWNVFFYLRHGRHQSVKGRHHEKCWTYRDGAYHGWPYGCSTYEPRAIGATYSHPEWTPRRSYYYAYQPGFIDLPYGFSPEPYYGPVP